MTMQDAPFNSEMLEALLDMDEGPTLDFKREQYPFGKETAEVKSELLKDILAMVNTHRYRTAYILVGVEEVRGGRSKVVGVDRHWEDATLHQFVNSKTNRLAEFDYMPFQVDDKEIGVFRIPIQDRPIYAFKDYGKVSANTVYLRDGSSTGVASPDDIADMGRFQTPKLLEWFIRRLQNMARNSVEVTAQQWFDHPGRQGCHDSQLRPQDYTEAHQLILRLTEHRPLEREVFSKGIDSYRSVRWVFNTFEELADQCTQTIRITGPSLMELGGLTRAILEMEGSVDRERKTWDEYRIRMKDEGDALPNPANYNLLSLARKVICFIDVLEDEGHYRDPDYDSWSRFPQTIFLRSPEWGEWRR